jgi:hypothetical protein
VEVFPTIYPPKPRVVGGHVNSRSPRRVMATASCCWGSLVEMYDTSTYGFYLELGQYS